MAKNQSSDLGDLKAFPYDNDAEIALIGSVLINPEALRTLDLAPEEFYIHRHGMIWEAMTRLYRQRVNVDFVTLSAELDRVGQLEEIGGQPYLIGAINATPSSLHAEDYAGILRDKARRRNILQISNELAKAAFGKDSFEEAVSKAMTGLAQNNGEGMGAVHWSKFMSDLYDEVDRATKNPRDVWGISTGLRDLDIITGGLHQKENTIISGEPGLGKSLLGLQIVEAAANPKIGNASGAVYEMEMSALQTVRRCVSRNSKVPTRVMQTGKIDDSQLQAFTMAIEKLSTYDVYLSEDPYWTTNKLRADLARLKDRAGIKWFLVDYLELLKDVYGDDIERTKFISGQLKAICKDLNLCGITIQGMNKAGMQTGGKAGVAGSVKIVYDADNIFILRKTEGNGNLVRLEAEKLREGDGSGNFIDLVKLPGFPAFGEKVHV